MVENKSLQKFFMAIEVPQRARLLARFKSAILFYRYREIEKTKLFHFLMTSMIMFTLLQSKIRLISYVFT